MTTVEPAVGFRPEDVDRVVVDAFAFQALEMQPSRTHAVGVFLRLLGKERALAFQIASADDAAQFLCEFLRAAEVSWGQEIHRAGERYMGVAP